MKYRSRLTHRWVLLLHRSAASPLILAWAVFLAVATLSASLPAADAGAEPDGERSKEEVRPSDLLGFGQEKIHAEMSELEERMFRLAEALKEMEPESSSRLMLGLKFSRQELLLHRMEELITALTKMKLDGAIDEQKKLISELQRLQELLLSRDLDFQLQLERLRQIRAVLKRLDIAIKEEDREQRWSENTSQLEDTVARHSEQLKSLDQLIIQQQSHLDDVGKFVKEGSAPAAKEGLAKKQTTTRDETQVLSDIQTRHQGDQPTHSHLPAAIEHMTRATTTTVKAEWKDAQSSMTEALAELNKERARQKTELERMQAQLAEKPFQRYQSDQITNRGLTEEISEMIRQLGDSGGEALGETLRATTSMSNAEGELGDRRAGAAGEFQMAALQSLKFAREKLQEEEQRLLNQIRGEVKQRVIEGLIFMLEKPI